MVLSKRKIICLVFALFCFSSLLLVAGCSKKEQSDINHYVMNLSYNEQQHLLFGEEQIKYFNNSENAFNELHFHLYPNAFQEGAKNKVVASSKKSEAYSNGESYGFIDIESVTFERGEKASYSVGGEDENILIVQLQEELFPDECVEINISFKVQIANINHRLGYGDNTVNFGNFYPIACVYEDGKGFSESLYHSNGDPFYSDCSNYDVTISYNSNFSLASTGDIVDEKNSGGEKQTVLQEKNVRDFCFVLSEKFEKISQKIGETTVNYYGYNGDEDFENNLNIASAALGEFNKLFGIYPYKQLSIVKANFIHGGMEFPNIVLISDTVSKEDFAYVIVHEIAHQWWYGVVGNDQYNHAWQDEALAEYSTLLFYKNHPQYGEDYRTMIENATKSYKLFVKVYQKVNGSVDGKMDKPLCEFETEPEYVECTYTKGVMMMDSIRESIGEKRLLKALQNYYNNFKYKNAFAEDFIAAFVKVGGSDMESFIRSWLNDRIVFK